MGGKVKRQRSKVRGRESNIRTFDPKPSTLDSLERVVVPSCNGRGQKVIQLIGRDSSVMTACDRRLVGNCTVESRGSKVEGEALKNYRRESQKSKVESPMSALPSTFNLQHSTRSFAAVWLVLGVPFLLVPGGARAQTSPPPFTVDRYVIDAKLSEFDRLIEKQQSGGAKDASAPSAKQPASALAGATA